MRLPIGCSRSTIREALKSLEVQGLVQNTTGPGGGARVAPVSINRIVGLLSNYFYFQSISTAQIYQIRRLIEPELAFSVVGHLTAAHFAALDKAIEVQSAFVKSAYETYLARVTKIGELYAEFAKETYKPFEAYTKVPAK